MSLKKHAIAALTVLILSGINLANAGELVQTFDFTEPNLPTWVRPNQNGSAPPTTLFGPGSNQYADSKVPMAYFTTTIHVDTTGTYQFFSAHPDDDGDLFTLLYQTSFDANAPFANVLIANDDAYKNTAGVLWDVDSPNAQWGTGEAYGSGFEYTLTANTDYVFVTTLFSGTFFPTGANKIDTLTISGPGEISLGSVSAVPEPSTLALFSFGLAAAAVRRRKNQG